MTGMEKGSPYKYGSAEYANLGSARAESDRAMLDQAFVRTSDFENLARGPVQSFVVGRRGAGKSALFNQLGVHFRKAPDSVVLELRPDEADMRTLYSVLRRALGENSTYRQVKSVMRHVWQAVLVEHCLEMVQRHHRSSELRERAGSRLIPAWHQSTPFLSAEALLQSVPLSSNVDEYVAFLKRETRLSASFRVVAA